MITSVICVYYVKACVIIFRCVHQIVCKRQLLVSCHTLYNNWDPTGQIHVKFYGVFLMTSLVILSTFGENKTNSFIVNGYLYTCFDNISPFTGKYKKWNRQKDQRNGCRTKHLITYHHTKKQSEVGTEFIFIMYLLLRFRENLWCVQFLYITNLMHSSFFVYVYSNSLHVSSTLVLIIRRIDCINTSNVCHSIQVTVQCAGLDGSVPTQSDTYQMSY